MRQAIKHIGYIEEITQCYCTSCNAVYEVDANQVEYIKYTDYGGFSEMIHGFYCLNPSCHCIVEIKNKVPKDAPISERDHAS